MLSLRLLRNAGILPALAYGLLLCCAAAPPAEVIAQTITQYAAPTPSFRTARLSPNVAAPATGQLGLTAQGVADGFRLSVFASGLPNNGSYGPMGVAVTSAGNVLVTDFGGYPPTTYSFADRNGQTPASALNAANVGAALFGITNASGTIYAVNFATGDLDSLSTDGSIKGVLQAIGTNGFGEGISTNPVNQHIFVDGPSGILDIDPTSNQTRTVNNQIGDGLSLSPDGQTVYLEQGGAINGYDTTTGQSVYSSGFIQGIADGVAVIQGENTFTGDLVVNTNGGIVWLINPRTNASTEIASGGTRGDFIGYDPTDGSLFLTQTSSIYRLSCGVNCLFSSGPLVSWTLGPQSSTNQQGTEGEPIGTATGNFVFQHTDLAMPGRGLPFQFTRTYNSRDTFAGPFGTGWTFSYNIFLRTGPNNEIIVKQGDGHEEFYDPRADGTYISATPGAFSTLVKNGDGSYTLTLKSQTRERFDNSGQLTALSDRRGNALTFAHDGTGNLTTITDSVGRTVTLTYDGNNHLVQISDPIGRTVRYGYDAHGNLVAVTDPVGKVMRFSYNSNHQITQMVDQNGNTALTNRYDNSGRVVAQTNGRGRTWQLRYDSPSARQTTAIDPLGNSRVDTYNELDQLTKRVDADGGTIRYTYDAHNERTSVTDQNSHTATFTYDVSGNVTSITDPLGHASTYTYDSMNDLTSATSPNGATTELTYSASGNLTQITNPLGAMTAYAYDRFGERVQETDARGNSSRYSYDADGNLTTITDPLGNVTKLRYDAIGRLVGGTDASGHAVTLGYDADGRMTAVTDALGNRTTFTYDATGHLVATTDPKGNRTTYAYDPSYDLASMTDALGGVTRFGYDADGNRISIADPDGHTTRQTFDALNQLISIADPMGRTTRYRRDAAGNIVAVTDPDGTTNTLSYDADDRIAHVAYGDGSSVTYTFDADGNRLTMVDTSGTTSYSYDALDELTAVGSKSGTIAYSYDLLGLRTRMALPDGKEVNYEYDGDNRLQRVTGWHDDKTVYKYGPAGNLTRIIYPNGTDAQYSYDANNRLVGIRDESLLAPKNQRLLALANYTLDPLGNRLSVTEGTAYSDLVDHEYSYDALSRLTAAETSRDGRPIARMEWTYDADGNRLDQTSETPQGQHDWTLQQQIAYDYDASNELLNAGATSYTYDANGNRIEESNPADGTSTVYTYDAANRLASVKTGANQVNYIYDGEGNKIERIATADDDTFTTDFLNDTAGALGQVIEETEGGGDITFLRGLGLIAEQVQGAIGSAKGVFTYHSDGLGSTLALSDSRGKPRAGYAYRAWGSPVSGEEHTGGVRNAFLFTGQDRDSTTGLYYLHERWYDPNIGRFLTPDPIGFASGFNKYAYSDDNPTSLIDPTGLCPNCNAVSTAPLLLTPVTVQPSAIAAGLGGVLWTGLTSADSYVAAALPKVYPKVTGLKLPKSARRLIRGASYLNLAVGVAETGRSFQQGGLPSAAGTAVQQFGPGLLGKLAGSLVDKGIITGVAAGRGSLYVTDFAVSYQIGQSFVAPIVAPTFGSWIYKADPSFWNSLAQ